VLQVTVSSDEYDASVEGKRDFHEPSRPIRRATRLYANTSPSATTAGPRPGAALCSGDL